MSPDQQPKARLCASRPLLSVRAVQVLLDCTSRRVAELVDEGRLLWAWDIASQDAAHREPRVWVWSVLAMVEGAPQPEPSHEDVIQSLFPHDAPEIRTPELQRMFSASQSHVQSLIDAGELRGLNRPGKGPNGVVRVTRASVVEFLKFRRIT